MSRNILRCLALVCGPESALQSNAGMFVLASVGHSSSSFMERSLSDFTEQASKGFKKEKWRRGLNFALSDIAKRVNRRHKGAKTLFPKGLASAPLASPWNEAFVWPRGAYHLSEQILSGLVAIGAANRYEGHQEARHDFRLSSRFWRTLRDVYSLFVGSS